MARRFTMVIPFLALLLAQISFGAAAIPGPNAQQPRDKAPINILSIVPAQGEPGMTVSLYGAGFSEKTTVFLGGLEVPAKVVSAKQLSFDIPKLDPGLYALFLKREDGSTSKPYNFMLLSLKPMANALVPDTITACAAGHDRDVVVKGRNFTEGSQILFDGAAIGSRFSSSESLSFATPQIADGLHQVQVRNSGDALSGVLGLTIDARPEITGITQGEQYVNSYNLVIDGRNFQQNSVLVVAEEQSIEQSGSQPYVDVRRITSGTATATEREHMVYINCNRIIYQRYPYSTTPKNLRLQVVNGGGGESSIVSVSAP